MPHSLRKIRKFRGSRTVGYGRIGQHRDSGSKGYRKVGRHKHLWSYVNSYLPGYFGKNGFVSPQSLHRKNNAINIQRLTEIIPLQKDGKNTIDLTSLGYTKLLGSGQINQPLTITVPSCSKSAQEKIVKAGGKIITPSKANGE
jgi:large subunit ribosomal protein L15